MLHKINLPHSWKQLQWILALQHRLLVKLCDPTMTPEQVTAVWVANRFPKLPAEWVASFCNRTFERISLLARMKTIAGFDAGTKARLLADFEHDVNFREAIANSHYSFHFHSLQCIADAGQRQDVRTFFESFYTAQFYFAANSRQSGYYIPHRRSECTRYHQTQFVTDFNAGQTIRVCAFCDGALSGVQVDHFYPKSNQPFLSCHPLNLTPICGECNKAKLQREPTDNAQNSDNVFVHWGHPYLRPLAGAYTIEFVRDAQPLRPEIRTHDDETYIRLENLESLIGLKPRWQKALEHRVVETKERLDGYRRYLQRKGQDSDLSHETLLDKLAMWAEELPVGTDSFGLLGRAYLQQAAAQNPLIFEELAKHSQTEMPSLA